MCPHIIHTMTSYNDINSTKAIYTNISVDDMRSHYTLWSEEGSKKWYVYKCRTKGPLSEFGKSFKSSTWIMMSPGLHNQEGQLNNNFMPFMSHMTIDAINRGIIEMRGKIQRKNTEEDNDPTPLWYEASENYLDEKVKEYKINVSIGSMINTIRNILQSSGGDILSIINVVKNINIEGVFNFSKSTDKKRVVKTTTDSDGVNVYILFDYIHKTTDSVSSVKRVFGFSKKKIHVIGHYYIFKPKNKAAREICKRLLNCKVGDLIRNAAAR